jgi:hypothetical protein
MKMSVKGRLTTLCVSLIIASLILANPSDADIDPKDIVGVWLLDEGKGKMVTEITGKGKAYEGEIDGKVKWDKGQFNGALEFDGTTQVKIEDNDALRLGKKQTVMAWIYPSERVNDWARVVGKGQPTPRNYGLWRHVDGWSLFQIYPGCNAWINGNKDTEAPLKEWTHLAGTYDGKNIVLFVNGKQVASAACGTDPATSADPLTFGYAGFHTFFNGLIDEVALFSAVLDEKDIQDAMNKGFTNYLAVEPERKLTTTWGTIKSQTE